MNQKLVRKLTDSSRRLRFGALSALLLVTQILPFSGFLTTKVSAADTGFLVPTSTHAPNNWNTNTVANIQNSDNVYVSEVGGQQQGYSDFNLSVPAGSTINGIEVQLEANSTDPSGCRLGVALSWNNGGNYSNSTFFNLSSTDENFTLGGPSYTASRTWSASELSNANFVVRVEDDDPGSNCDGDAVTSVDRLAVKAYYTAPAQPAANPPLAQSCGLDIALVLDNSESITASQRTQMKTAMIAFTSALAGTPTQFSVTRFGNSSALNQAFTSNVSAVNTAINNLPANPTGEYTNWQSGLTTAQSSFSGGRGGVPNLMIFATDGDPTASSAGANDTSQPNVHLDPAITSANVAKNAGTRILALGIGNPTVSRLQAISGPSVNSGIQTSDVITTNFDNLAQDLASFAEATCGGTLTVSKLIDHDSNPDTPAIQGGSGWNFTVDNGQYTTDTNGKTAAVNLNSGTYSVTETQKPGYELVEAVCQTNQSSMLGQFNSQTKSVEGVNVTNSSIVSCTFVNRPTTSNLIVNKVVSGGSAAVSDFGFSVNGGNSVSFEGDGSNMVAVTEGDYEVVESNPSKDYDVTYSEDCAGTIAGGQTKTCTITNTYNPDTKLTLRKAVTGGNASPTEWTLKAESGDYIPINEKGAFVEQVGDTSYAATAKTVVVPGTEFGLSESGGPAGYSAQGWVCQSDQDTQNQYDFDAEDETVTLLPGARVTCTVTNVYDPEPETGSITGTKFYDVNKNSQWDEGEETLEGFTINLYNACVAVKDISDLLRVAVVNDCTEELLASDVTNEDGKFQFNNLPPGDYKVCEIPRSGWTQTYPVDEDGDPVCWLVTVHENEECIVDFGNTASEPGKVISTSTMSTPPAQRVKVLENTGFSLAQAAIVAMSIIGAAGSLAVFSRRKLLANSITY